MTNPGSSTPGGGISPKVAAQQPKRKRWSASEVLLCDVCESENPMPLIVPPLPRGPDGKCIPPAGDWFCSDECAASHAAAKGAKALPRQKQKVFDAGAGFSATDAAQPPARPASRRVCALILHGLPGSGKSTLLASLRKHPLVSSALDIDDLMPASLKASMAAGRTITAAERSSLIVDVLSPALLAAVFGAKARLGADPSSPPLVVLAAVLPTATSRSSIVDQITRCGHAKSDVALVRLRCPLDELLARVRGRAGGHFAGEDVLSILHELDSEANADAFEAEIDVPTGGAREEESVRLSSEALGGKVIEVSKQLFGLI